MAVTFKLDNLKAAVRLSTQLEVKRFATKPSRTSSSAPKHNLYTFKRTGNSSIEKISV